MKKNHILFLFAIAILSSIGVAWAAVSLNTSSDSDQYGSDAWIDKQIMKIQSRTNIDKKVLRLSLTAYSNAQKRGLSDKQLLTVIDYSKPATQKRLWVFDLKSGRTLFNTWVSHGKNSGGIKATSFSNSPGSLKSSIGVFVTDSSYIGKNGYSLHLRGLERGVNDNAYRRSVVIHGAWYVNPATITRYGQIGRSWGCPAVSKDLAKSLINTIKNKTVVFAYYPDRSWLRQSKFLAG